MRSAERWFIKLPPSISHYTPLFGLAQWLSHETSAVGTRLQRDRSLGFRSVPAPARFERAWSFVESGVVVRASLRCELLARSPQVDHRIARA